ncbi:MAG: hypothetical protein VX938_02855, partial [Myxococcota bacterium]|nr:hypothetical protein [Myxococcota bacterium]
IVVALDSIAHIVPRDDGKTKWNEDATPCNPDTENVNALIRHFKSPDAMGLLDADAPVFAFGVSNGGSMTSRAAQHLSFSAVATYITNAKQFHEPEATIPPVFIVAGEYDSTVSTEGPCLLYASALEQGIDAEFHLNVPEPVTPGFFTRINGVDCDLSQEIIASFTDAGVLDDDGNVLVNPGDYSTWQPHLPPSASAYQNDVRDLLDERAAEHSLTHDFRQENILFFNQHATPLPMPEAFTCP